MTWVDLVVLALLGLSAVFAFMRGFVREALGLGAWAGGIWTAWRLYPLVQPYALRLISNPEIADPAAFAASFLVTLIVFLVLAAAISNAIRRSVLGGLDRSLGLLFGLLRGALFIAIAYIAAGLVFPVEQWPAPVLDSRSLPYAYRIALWVVDQMPPRFAPKLDAPPKVRAKSGDLLQSAPRGSALGRRTAQEQEDR